MEYKEQLKTSAWLRKKYEIMKRDNFVCSKCLADNFESRLEVHHIAYKMNAMAWEYQDYFLVTLCRICHQLEHDLGNIYDEDIIKEWVIELSKPNPLTDEQIEALSRLF